MMLVIKAENRPQMTRPTIRAPIISCEYSSVLSLERVSRTRGRGGMVAGACDFVVEKFGLEAEKGDGV